MLLLYALCLYALHNIRTDAYHLYQRFSKNMLLAKRFEL